MFDGSSVKSIYLVRIFWIKKLSRNESIKHIGLTRWIVHSNYGFTVDCDFLSLGLRERHEWVMRSSAINEPSRTIPIFVLSDQVDMPKVFSINLYVLKVQVGTVR